MHSIRLCVFLCAATFLSAEMRTSVSQFGITWTFDKAYECGQFVNGDWWVVGPVTVQSVSPAPAAGRNGSMISPPVGEQSFDDRSPGNFMKYNAGLAVTFPKLINTNQSLVSSISSGASNCKMGNGSDGWMGYDTMCRLSAIRAAAILTVVPAAQPATMFRPAYVLQQDPLFFDADDILWDLLPGVSAPASAPGGTDVARYFQRPWIDHITNWTGRYLHPAENMRGYGREICQAVSVGALYMMLDKPDIRDVVIGMIQLGIDNYGIVRSGSAWGADGGHLMGRKFPTVFAGMMLDDSGMKSPGIYGNEDHQSYYDGATPMWHVVPTCDGQNGTSGGRPCGETNPYFPINLPAWVGEALAGRMMHMEDEWAHDPFFALVDRWVAGGGYIGGGTFVSDMWTTYRNNLPDGVAGDEPRMLPAYAVTAAPNPMGDHISFTVTTGTPQRGVSTVSIYDHTGNMIWLSHETVPRPSGRDVCTVTWEGTNVSGQPAQPGVYFYRVTTPEGIAAGRIIKTY